MIFFVVIVATFSLSLSLSSIHTGHSIAQSGAPGASILETLATLEALALSTLSFIISLVGCKLLLADTAADRAAAAADAASNGEERNPEFERGQNSADSLTVYITLCSHLTCTANSAALDSADKVRESEREKGAQSASETTLPHQCTLLRHRLWKSKS